MIFTKTKFEQLYVIEIEVKDDDRGYFARTWCKNEFEINGLPSEVVQSNISNNKKRGTLRGLHYQREPFGENKILTCLNGAIHDVVIDLRVNSKTYLEWISFDLTSRNRKMLFIPAGFAHGYQTLTINSLILYYMSEFYNPQAEMGIRYNDPFFKIDWPLQIGSISNKDINWGDFDYKKFSEDSLGKK